MYQNCYSQGNQILFSNMKYTVQFAEGVLLCQCIVAAFFLHQCHLLTLKFFCLHMQLVRKVIFEEWYSVF